MSELLIHHDQTTMQPVWFVCLSPKCAEPGKRDFPFESDYPKCPKCTNSGYPFVQKRILVHLLLPDPMGNIQGQWERFRMACDKSRFGVATITNGEAGTDNVLNVNCPGCLKAVDGKQFEPTGAKITASAASTQ